MTTLEELKNEIEQIKARNNKVERDKAWEGSWTRKGSLIIFTYFAIGFYLNAIKIVDPWINAVVPAVGFFLSTLTLPFLRRLWEKFLYNK